MRRRRSIFRGRLFWLNFLDTFMTWSIKETATFHLPKVTVWLNFLVSSHPSILTPINISPLHLISILHSQHIPNSYKKTWEWWLWWHFLLSSESPSPEQKESEYQREKWPPGEKITSSDGIQGSWSEGIQHCSERNRPGSRSDTTL